MHIHPSIRPTEIWKQVFEAYEEGLLEDDFPRRPTATPVVASMRSYPPDPLLSNARIQAMKALLLKFSQQEQHHESTRPRPSRRSSFATRLRAFAYAGKIAVQAFFRNP